MTTAENIESFDDAIKLIENFGSTQRPHTVGTKFQRIRDLEYHQGNKSIASKAQLELDAFNFVLKDGLANPLFTGTNNDGSPFAIPDIGRYTDRELDYFQKRLNETSNPYLKLRYSQILWTSRRKNFTFSKGAVDQSLKIIQSKVDASESENSETDLDSGLNAIAKNAFHLSKHTNYKHKEVSNLISKLVRTDNPSLLSAVDKLRLISLMIENSKSFSPKSLEGVEELCWAMAKNAQDPNAAIDFLKLGEAIDKKLEVKSSRWTLESARHYEKLVEWAERTENLAVTDFCLSAADAYEAGGNHEKASTLREKYQSLKSSQKFKSASLPIDQDALQKHIQECGERAVGLMKYEPNQIFAFLASEDSILPNVRRLRESAAGQRENAIFFNIVPKVTLDKRGHVAKHAAEDEELAHSSMLWHYGFDVSFDKIIQMGTIVFEGIKSGKISVESLTNFLRLGWLGADLNGKVGQTPITYRWTDQLIPALSFYIREIQQHLADPSYGPQVLLATDSLVIKFEGILRDLLQRGSKATTFKTKPDRKKRKITRERDISDLLNDPNLAHFFSENEIQFFKYILTEHDGWNLRGEIAHCLRYSQEYSANQFNLLFVALLRFSKFESTGKPFAPEPTSSADVIRQPNPRETTKKSSGLKKAKHTQTKRKGK